MEYILFEERLIQTLINRNRIVFVTIILVGISLLIEVLHYCRTKSNSGVSLWNIFAGKPTFKIRLTTKQQIFRDIVVISVLTSILLFSAFTVYQDTTHQQYLKVEALYSRNERTSDGNLLSYGHVYIENGEKKMVLELPFDWTDEEFPLGTFYGTVWYSEESKVILAFATQ